MAIEKCYKCDKFEDLDHHVDGTYHPESNEYYCESCSEDLYGQLVCNSCEQPCGTKRDKIYYSATHCNHGVAGVHETNNFSSDCCGADYVEWL